MTLHYSKLECFLFRLMTSWFTLAALLAVVVLLGRHQP